MMVVLRRGLHQPPLGPAAPTAATLGYRRRASGAPGEMTCLLHSTELQAVV